MAGASTVANSVGASKAASARNDALAAERIRQRGYDKEAAAINQNSQDLYSNFDADQTQKASDLGQYFQDQKISDANANADATAASTIPQSGSPLTVHETQKQSDAATAFTDQRGQALGNLRAFGDVLGTDSRLQGRNAALIGQIGGFKQGSSNVLPLELDAAQSAGSGYQTLGDVLQLGSSLAVNKGISSNPKTASSLNLFGVK